MTLPIIAVSFGTISNVTLSANILVLRFVLLAMLLTFVAGLSLEVIPFAAASLIALPAQWLLGYMDRLAEWLGGLSFAQTEYAPSAIVIIFFYIVLNVVVIDMILQSGCKLREGNIVD